MNKAEIIKLAKSNDWELLDDQPDNVMVSFYKPEMRINVWYTKMTVATCINHPKQGKTQLFRKNVSMGLLDKIFKNPRIHTFKGYYTK